MFSRIPVKEGEVYFTVFKVVFDILSEFQLDKKLHLFLSLCVRVCVCVRVSACVCVCACNAALPYIGGTFIW